VPGLGMMVGRRSAATYRRRREFIDHDDVVITIGLAPNYEVEHLGRTLSLGRGDAVMMTGAEPAMLRAATDGEYISMRAPVSLISPLVGNLGNAYGRPIPASTPALRLLVSYLRILDETEILAAPTLRRQLVTHVHDLMALAIGAAPDAAIAAKDRGARAARLNAIKDDIADHLDKADLSVSAIALRHRTIPRYVQRLFEADGTTFTEYVLEQRLARAHRLLRDPRHAEGKISTVAFEAGFGDLSYFNRAFRRRYGVAPTEVRAAAKTE
jgi:AraC-like DNA-binding protein